MRFEERESLSQSSSTKIFWYGFLWGLGRGIGSLIGWLALIAILVFLFKSSGLKESFQEILDTAKQFQLQR